MPKIITFFEHERKTFKDLENEGLSRNEIKKLIKLNDKLKIFNTKYHKSIKAKQYVGFVAVDNKIIQVLPKVFKECDYENKDKIKNY